MGELQGIKETQEAAKAGLAVAAVLVKHLKDGFQAGQDLAAIFAEWQGDADLQAKISAGFKDADKVPAEVKDLDVGEVFQLLTGVYPEVMDLIEAFSTPKASE